MYGRPPSSSSRSQPRVERPRGADEVRGGDGEHRVAGDRGAHVEAAARLVERVDDAQVGELGDERGDRAAQRLLEVERFGERARGALERAGVVLVALARVGGADVVEDRGRADDLALAVAQRHRVDEREAVRAVALALHRVAREDAVGELLVADHLAQRAPERGRARPAEQLLGRRVELDHVAGAVGRDERVRDELARPEVGVQDRRVALAERLVRAAGEVAVRGRGDRQLDADQAPVAAAGDGLVGDHRGPRDVGDQLVQVVPEHLVGLEPEQPLGRRRPRAQDCVRADLEGRDPGLLGALRNKSEVVPTHRGKRHHSVGRFTGRVGALLSGP